MEKIIDLLQQSKSLLSGEPSEENATEAYQLIAMALKEAQALRQPVVSGNSALGVAVAFADWVNKNNWIFHRYSYSTKVTEWRYRKLITDEYQIKTTQELYDEFQRQK
jgi:hypothetical protein